MSSRQFPGYRVVEDETGRRIVLAAVLARTVDCRVFRVLAPQDFAFAKLLWPPTILMRYKTAFMEKPDFCCAATVLVGCVSEQNVYKRHV
ncbi:MAG: hypothetical protein QE272_08550 [Nevskia sp.]|nr:hypothetical protein [Nevskia sp.]